MLMTGHWVDTLTVDHLQSSLKYSSLYTDRLANLEALLILRNNQYPQTTPRITEAKNEN